MSIERFLNINVVNHRNIYVVSEFVDEKTNSTGYYWYKIIKGLSSKRDNIYVISLDKSCRKAIIENDNATYISIKIGSYSRDRSFVRKLLGDIVLSLKFAEKIAKYARKKDIIFSATNPSMMLLFISILRPLIGFKWLVLVNDVFPENLVPAKLISKKSYIYRIIRLLSNYAYKQADKVIVIGRDMELLLGKKTDHKVPIEYIPNWVDLDDISADIKNVQPSFDNQNFENKVIFQFFGNMGIVQGLDILLASISKTTNRNAKFIFIGSGSGVQLVKNFIADHSTIDIALHPPIHFKDNNIGLAACDVAMVCLAPGMSGLAVPSKAYFSLAADKPIFVIGDKGAELEFVVKENACIGWYCSSYNSDKIAKIIDQICELDLSRFRNKPREIIRIKYDYLSAIEKYSALINEL